jgi:hyperosmotically inducible protein
MRVIFRAVLVLAVVALGAYLLGFWSPNDFLARWRAGTPTTVTVDTKAVQGRLDNLGERTGNAVQKVDAFVTEAGLSGKIKSKMALDDVVRARTIDVSTVDGVVTLTGTVQSIAERDQALRLARDTKGVTRVVDHLIVRP